MSYIADLAKVFPPEVVWKDFKHLWIWKKDLGSKSFERDWRFVDRVAAILSHRTAKAARLRVLQQYLGHLRGQGLLEPWEDQLDGLSLNFFWSPPSNENANEDPSSRAGDQCPWQLVL